MRPMWLQVTKLMPKILRAHIEAFLIDGPSEQDEFLMWNIGIKILASIKGLDSLKLYQITNQ